MDLSQRQQLVSAMMKVIRLEGLPIPERICVRNPLYGTKIARSSCKKIDDNNRYKIIVSITEARVINNNGVEKKVLGVMLPVEKIIDISAKEIAHLKYKKQDYEYNNYITHIKNILLLEMGLQHG